MTTLAPTLQAFFTQRLIGQLGASPHTVAAYRDTCRLLLSFAGQQTGKAPSRLDLSDLDAALIGAFLEDLESTRGNSPRTRNIRLAAVRSLFRFAALRHPEHAALIQRVLAIPAKRFERAVVCFLSPAEVDALLAAPDRATWRGRPRHLAWPTRPRAAAGRGHYRPAGLRADQDHLPGPPPGYRRVRAL
ncbi:MAG: tyrosine-type recombinase/integrase [Pseudonocardiaceae bacterium]